MNNTELLLCFISFMLVIIFIYVRWIYLRTEYGIFYDPDKPVNMYGENLTDAIQNGIVRGQQGISTYQ